MTNQDNRPVFNFNINFDNPETATAFATAMGSFLSLLQGEGTAAQNHRRVASRAPRAVADAPAGETAKELRDWLKAYQAKTGTVLQIDGEELPTRGQLPKKWREAIVNLRAEVAKEEEGDGDSESDMLDGDVVETPPAEAPPAERRERKRFGRQTAKA